MISKLKEIAGKNKKEKGDKDTVKGRDRSGEVE